MFRKIRISHTSISFCGVGLCLVMAVAVPLSARDTIVDGKTRLSDVVEERIVYDDLDLKNRNNQMLLIARVRKAAVRVCHMMYSHVMWDSRCPRQIYRATEPQINFAIANAQKGSRVAINLVIPPSQ